MVVYHEGIYVLILRVLKFPNEGKIVTINQLTYSTILSTNLDMVVPFISGKHAISSFNNVGPSWFKDSSLPGVYLQSPLRISYMASLPMHLVSIIFRGECDPLFIFLLR
jgi:hypothetical protein